MCFVGVWLSWEGALLTPGTPISIRPQRTRLALPAHPPTHPAPTYPPTHTHLKAPS